MGLDHEGVTPDREGLVGIGFDQGMAGKCQGSCRINHVMFASAFSGSRGGFPGLSKTEAGGVQLRV
ncbi:MAG: hypothetical protein AADX98_24245, partial [Thiocapsa sp. C3-3m]